jgi:hypothetical protein
MYKSEQLETFLVSNLSVVKTARSRSWVSGGRPTIPTLSTAVAICACLHVSGPAHIEPGFFVVKETVPGWLARSTYQRKTLTARPIDAHVQHTERLSELSVLAQT